MAVTGQGQYALRTFYGGLLEKAEGPQAVTNTEQACERQLSIDTLFEQMERGIQKQEEWQREKIDYSLSLTRVGFRALQHLKSQKLAHLTLASSPLSYYDTARLHLPSLKTLFYDVNGDPLVTYWHQSFFFPKLLPHVHIGANSPLLGLDRTLCEGNRCIVLSCLPLLAYAGQDYGHEDMGKPSFKKEHPFVRIEKFKTPDGREWDQTHCLKHGFFYKNQPNDWGLTPDPLRITFRPPPSAKGEELSEEKRRKQLTHFTTSAPQDASSNNEVKAPQTELLHLPEELIRHIATYLDDHNTLSFGLSCKFLCTLLDLDMSTLGLSPLARYLAMASRVGLSIPEDYGTAPGIAQLDVPFFSYQEENVQISPAQLRVTIYPYLQMHDLEGKEIAHKEFSMNVYVYDNAFAGDPKKTLRGSFFDLCTSENRVLQVGPFYTKPAPSPDMLDREYVIPILNHRFQQWWVGNLESIFEHNPDVLTNIRGPRTSPAQMPSQHAAKEPASDNAKEGST